MYPYVLFFHVATVMSFFGVGVATDAALVHARKHAADGAAIRRLLLGRNLRVELIVGLLTIVLGITLLFVNPQGMAIFKTGGWIHAKVGAALAGIVMVLVSHRGIREEGAAGWVVPVRGTGLLLALVAVFAAKVLR
jgi:uncharacterized membrane protein